MVKYPNKLLDYFHDRKHAGSIVSASNVVVAEAGTVEQGEVIRFYIKIENDAIKQVRFKAHGSVALIAVSEFISTWLEHKKVTDALMLSEKIVLNSLELSSLYNHVAVLSVQSIKKTLRELV